MILNTWLTYLMLVSGAGAVILAVYMVIDKWRNP
jgi:hypothetical protein